MMLETERLIVRDVQTEDAASFAQMAADGSLRDVGFGPDCGKWINAWIIEAQELAAKNRPDGDYLAYTVVLKNSGAVVGSVGCSWYEDLQEIGITYFIGAQYRNRGYAAEAARAYAEFFFSRYRAPRLIATIREDNPASWNAVEKAGFQLTGVQMYQDINDREAALYRFYERRRP